MIRRSRRRNRVEEVAGFAEEAVARMEAASRRLDSLVAELPPLLARLSTRRQCEYTMPLEPPSVRHEVEHEEVSSKDDQ